MNRPRPKRKFPGPAGILPDLRTEDVEGLNNSGNKLGQRVSEIVASKNSKILPQTQSPSQYPKLQGLLDKSPWAELLKTLELSHDDEDCLTKRMNINWVLSSAHQFPLGSKVPFLAMVLQEAPELPANQTGQDKPCRVKLMDSTGTIEAAMDPRFVKRFSRYLRPGTALAVTSAGILPFKRRVLLTLISKNIICMASESQENLGYAEDEDIVVDVTKEKLHAALDNVKVIEFSKFSRQKVLEAYENVFDPTVLQQFSRSSKTKTAQNSSASLFTTVGSEYADVFNDEDDDLFWGLDTESFDQLFTSSQQNSEVIGSEEVARENDEGSKSPSLNIVENTTAQDDFDEFEDEFDKELATLDEQAITSSQAANDVNMSPSVETSLDACTGETSQMNFVDGNYSDTQRSNEIPREVEFYSSDVVGATLNSNKKSQTCSPDLFESGQQEQLSQNQKSSPGVNYESSQQDADNFFDEFDQELDMLD